LNGATQLESRSRLRLGWKRTIERNCQNEPDSHNGSRS
jgi:hypothetical protein